MNSWSKIGLEWAVEMLHRMVMPLFLAYRIAVGLPICQAKNGDGRPVRA